tara:strand:+ start:979 stop:1605 length:627 start_codon:yes stop_codon:yes gene_type:complete
MISHQHRCIFIHIPKTAGTSIEKKLGHFETLEAGVQDHRTIRQIQPEPQPFWKECFAKSDAQSVTARQFRSYYKFTFVRNPWARAFSWYRNVMDDPRHRAKHQVPDDCSFGDFLKHHSDQWAMRPQLHWLEAKDGTMPLDFVGRFESLNQDFETVAKRLGLKDQSLPTLMMREGERPSYVAHYDDELRELVEARYHKEIERFGYQFGD